METRTYTDSIDIAAAPGAVYDLVSDVTRTGEWSPICRWCRWDDGDGPRVGARFTGHNETPDRTWETHCEVIVARRGEQFAWEVNGGLVRWGFSLDAVENGTRLTESWEFPPEGQAFFHDKYDAAEAAVQIDKRTTWAQEGIPATLAAIKKIAENG